VNKYDFLRRLKFFFASQIVIHSDALVVGGTAAKEFAISKGVDKNKIFIGFQCANGLTSDAYHQIKRGTAGRLNLLYLGRMIRLKGLDILIKAFARIEKQHGYFHLKIVGDGPFRKECELLSQALEVKNIEFTGSILPHKAQEEFAAADVFILPSRIDGKLYESWGLVINEALSAGLPIVTTDRNGASYDLVIPGKNGLLCNADDPDALYEAIVSLKNKDLIEMGKESRKIYDAKNNFLTMADGFSGAIEYALHKKRGSIDDRKKRGRL